MVTASVCVSRFNTGVKGKPRGCSDVVGGWHSVQHTASDLRLGGSARREPQPAGESAAAGGESVRVGEQQRGPGEMWHHPPVTGQDRAGPQRGAGTQGNPVQRPPVIEWLIEHFHIFNRVVVVWSLASSVQYSDVLNALNNTTPSTDCTSV